MRVSGMKAMDHSTNSTSDDSHMPKHTYAVDTMIQTNVVGLIHLTQLLVQDFKKRKHAGHIIQLGSVAGREPYPAGSIYCATKHAVRAFTTALHRELVDTPIRVSEVQRELRDQSARILD